MPSNLQTVDQVDLQRYVGKWYEIARMPNRFEKKCDRDVVAEYAMRGGVISVRNTCVRRNGNSTIAKGTAKVVDERTGAKLKVTFFWPFYGDYWIIGFGSGVSLGAGRGAETEIPVGAVADAVSGEGCVRYDREKDGGMWVRSCDGSADAADVCRGWGDLRRGLR